MAVLGSLIKGALGGYGKKPKVPEYVPVDPAAEQAAAISGNLAALPSAQRLASQTNAFNLEQLQKMLKASIPGYENIQGQQSAVIQAMLRGELPREVQNALQNTAAARAIGGGFGGTPAHRYLEARDFSRGVDEQIQRGLDSATRWMAATASMVTPHMMDVTSMFITPQQRIAYQFQNRENQFNRDWMANQIKAAPDPFKAALGDAFIQEEAQIMELVGNVAGMAAGMMCWVARAIYGDTDIRWRLFRQWLLKFAPRWLVRLYATYGERFAAWISNKPLVKAIIRRWMNRKVEIMVWHYSTLQAS